MSISGKSTRRDFLVASSATALAAATSAVSAQVNPSAPEANKVPATESTSFDPKDLYKSSEQRIFSGDSATQVSMPLGGIGVGSVCLNGYGGLQDFSIHQRPETTSLPEGFSCNSPEAAFAILHI